MIFVPLPFVVALLLVLVLIQMVRRSEHGWRDNPLFVVLISAYSLQSILIGLRWGYDLRQVLPLQAVLATAIAGLSWVSFRSLTREQRGAFAAAWPHLVPAVVVGLLLAVWPAPVSALIVVVFLGYGGALLWLTRLGPDGFVSARLDGVVRSYRALQVTGCAVIGSALMDVLINLDMSFGSGAHAGAVIVFGNVLALLVLGSAASVATAGTTAEDEATGVASLPTADTSPQPVEAQGSAEDAAIVAAVDALMQHKELYKDVELNLGRIARRLGLPARRVSSAINRHHGMSVSQYVNNYRIKEARRLLSETDLPVTRVLFDAGFLTKSNFNREFLRVTGLSPTAWRQAQRRDSAATA